MGPSVPREGLDDSVGDAVRSDSTGDNRVSFFVSAHIRAPRKIRGARAGQDAPPMLKRLSA
jgi:hypothetical protein